MSSSSSSKVPSSSTGLISVTISPIYCVFNWHGDLYKQGKYQCHHCQTPPSYHKYLRWNYLQQVPQMHYYHTTWVSHEYCCLLYMNSRSYFLCSHHSKLAPGHKLALKIETNRSICYKLVILIFTISIRGFLRGVSRTVNMISKWNFATIQVKDIWVHTYIKVLIDIDVFFCFSIFLDILFCVNYALFANPVTYVTGFTKTFPIGTRNEIQFIADYFMIAYHRFCQTTMVHYRVCGASEWH